MRRPRSARRQRPSLLAACVVLVAALPAAAAAEAAATARAPVSAADLAPWQGREVSALELSGLPAELRDQASAGLALAPRRKLIGRQFATLTVRAAEADLRRLRLLLARHGYPDAVVEARGEADGTSRVRLTVAVTPGAPVRYGTVVVHGLPEGLAAVADSVVTVLAAGRRFQEQTVRKAREDLLRALQQDGFASPEVVVRTARPLPAVADVTFVCAPGQRSRYRGLVIDGAPDDLVPLVRRTVSLAPGTPYSPAVINDTRRHLRQLQLFRQVRLHAEARDSTTLDLVADLRPRAMLTSEASVGTFTDNWLTVRAGVTHRNFWRRGRGLYAGASWATYSRDAELRTWWPALIGARSRTELRLRREIQDEDSYRLATSEVALSNLFTTWRHSSLRLGVTVSHGDLDDRSVGPRAFVVDAGLQTLLEGIFYRDTSDNPLQPSRGHRLTLQSSWSPPGFWTRTPFASVRAFGSRYQTLTGSGVLAMRLDGAVAWPLGDAPDLRPDRRWFAGGVSTMRGARRRQLGPRDGDGNPIGGEVRLLAGLEARMPVWSLLGVAVFVDSGQVWRRTADLDLGGVEAAAGVGLLVGTPIGPLRLDLARHLGTPAPGQPRTLLQFGIGHPY